MGECLPEHNALNSVFPALVVPAKTANTDAPGAADALYLRLLNTDCVGDLSALPAALTALGFQWTRCYYTSSAHRIWERG